MRLPIEEKLQEMYRNHGPTILEQPDRVESWLRYACPNDRREINVLLGALRLGIPQGILAGENNETLTRRLTDELAMAGDAASWAVGAWAAAAKHFVNAAVNGNPQVQIKPVASATVFRDGENRAASPPTSSAETHVASVAIGTTDWAKEKRLLDWL